MRKPVDNKIKASIVGASGYAGGELVRILLNHPNVGISQITSESLTGKPITISHPNLRSRTSLTYSKIADLEKCDVLFLGLPHKISMNKIGEFQKIADKIIDLSADFRLRNVEDYEKIYETKHTKPSLLDKFVYGIAELHREEIKKADLIACGGCEATCGILALHPLSKANVINQDKEIILDMKIGSSASGNKVSNASHHPERSGVLRSYKPTGHRHGIEISQETGFKNIYMSATATSAVRGILGTIQVFLKDGVNEKEIRKIYREAYEKEPFIRIVKERQGLYRYPEPKILSGTNFCDIGFEKEKNSNRLVVISAIDNLMKGTAGQAVQALNCMFGWDETTGLEFIGLHPV